MKLDFGKYRGCDLRDIPGEYLEWLVETTRKTADAAEAEIDRRQRAEQADIGWCERLIVAGYRDLAKRHHPDHGGDLKSMQEINAAVEVLREMVR